MVRQLRKFLGRGDRPSIPEQVAESLKDWSQEDILEVIFQNHPGLDRKKIRTGDFDIHDEDQQGISLRSGCLLDLHSGQLVMFIGLNDGFFYDAKLHGAILAEVVVDRRGKKQPHSLVITKTGNVKTYYGKDGRPVSPDRLVG